MKRDNKEKIHYEPDSDVLSWEVSNEPIDSAQEIGNVVVHFSKKNVPVLFEILEASKFLNQAKNLITPLKRESAPVSR